MLVIKVPIHLYIYMIGGLEHEFYFSIQLGISSSQLTHIFQRGRNQPPTIYVYIYIYLISFSRVHRDESHRIQTGQRSAAWKWPSEERTTNTLINLTMDAFQSGFHDGAMENHSLVIKHMAMENPPFSSMTYFFWLKGKIFGNTI